MEKYNKVIGDKGEDAAVRYLKRNGYKILDRNYNVRGGEIDIVAKDGEVIVFAEVKTRSSTDYGDPKEAVTYTKRQRLTKAAEHYMLKLGDVPLRFDVIGVLGRMRLGIFRVESIEHIKDAF